MKSMIYKLDGEKHQEKYDNLVLSIEETIDTESKKITLQLDQEKEMIDLLNKYIERFHVMNGDSVTSPSNDD